MDTIDQILKETSSNDLALLASIELDDKPPVEPERITPAETVVVPLKVFVPDKVKVPESLKVEKQKKQTFEICTSPDNSK